MNNVYLDDIENSRFSSTGLIECSGEMTIPIKMRLILLPEEIAESITSK